MTTNAGLDTISESDYKFEMLLIPPQSGHGIWLSRKSYCVHVVQRNDCQQ